jgi:protein gp37
VPDEWIDRVFAVMALAPQHTFQVLTKRPERMRAYACAADVAKRVWLQTSDVADHLKLWALAAHGAVWGGETPWPLRNVWLGTSIEDQATADDRIPHLLATPAAVRFISAEPLLGPLSIAHAYTTDAALAVLFAKLERGDVDPRGNLHWVICGGESGPGARPMHPDWARSLRDQCQAAGVPFFFKQWGEWEPCRGFACPDDLPRDGWHHFDPECSMRRVGKKNAGRLLDGREWNDVPITKGPSGE